MSHCQIPPRWRIAVAAVSLPCKRITLPWSFITHDLLQWPGAHRILQTILIVPNCFQTTILCHRKVKNSDFSCIELTPLNFISVYLHMCFFYVSYLHTFSPCSVGVLTGSVYVQNSSLAYLNRCGSFATSFTQFTAGVSTTHTHTLCFWEIWKEWPWPLETRMSCVLLLCVLSSTLNALALYNLCGHDGKIFFDRLQGLWSIMLNGGVIFVIVAKMLRKPNKSSLRVRIIPS